MERPPPSDQRRHPRLEAQLQVKIRFADLDRFRRVTTSDLSEGGPFLTSDNPKADLIWRPEINTRMLWPVTDKNSLNLALGGGFAP